MEGIIIKNQSNDYTVKTSKGINICKPRGKFRNEKITPLVGDHVIIDDINNYLLEIKPRKNFLIRPNIANVDIALIITSVKEPNFDNNLLDKLLTIISYNGIEPIICLTKTDLLNNTEEKEIKNIMSYYKKAGYKVITNNEIKEIKKLTKTTLHFTYVLAWYPPTHVLIGTIYKRYHIPNVKFPNKNANNRIDIIPHMVEIIISNP